VPGPLLWAVLRATRECLTIRGIPNGLHYCIVFTARMSIIYKCGSGPQATREPRLETRDVKEIIQCKVFSVSPEEPRRAIHIFVMYDARLQAEGNHSQHLLYMS
jgi:hypothetical protein